jgi:hypothetical protein
MALEDTLGEKEMITFATIFSKIGLSFGGIRVFYNVHRMRRVIIFELHMHLICISYWCT